MLTWLKKSGVNESLNFVLLCNAFPFSGCQSSFLGQFFFFFSLLQNIYIYIYTHVCMCVCPHAWALEPSVIKLCNCTTKLLVINYQLIWAVFFPVLITNTKQHIYLIAMILIVSYISSASIRYPFCNCIVS